MNLPTKRLASRIALPAVSILALAGTLLLAGWTAPAASAHAGAKHAASFAQSASATIAQDIKDSATYHNPLGPAQTALADQNALDPWARGTSVSRSAQLRDLGILADLSTPTQARGLTQVVSLLNATGWPGARLPADTALNKSQPWQAVMTASATTNTALVLVEKITHTGPQIAFVRLSYTASLGWRVGGGDTLITNRRQAAFGGESYADPQLQALLSAEYVK